MALFCTGLPSFLWVFRCVLWAFHCQKTFFSSVFKLASLCGVVKMETLGPLGSKNKFGPVGQVETASLSPTRLWVIWLCPSEVNICHCLPYLLCAHCTSCSLSFENAELISTSDSLSLLPGMLSLQTRAFRSWPRCLHRQTSLPDHFLHSPNPIYPSRDHGCCPMAFITMGHALFIHLVVFCPPALQSMLCEVGILSILSITL